MICSTILSFGKRINMEVRFLDIQNLSPDLDELILRDIKQIIDTRQLIGGDFNNRFERAFANYVQSEFCVGVGNGLDAITLLIQALNIPKSKKIVVPNNTFIATALAVVNLGYELICCDVDPDTRNISVETLKDVLIDQVGLVIFVPLYGNPSGGNSVKKFCDEQNIPIIFDCAQAHGARIDGISLGRAWGNCSWSFYPGKNLGAYGDGGAVTTGSELVRNEIRMRANYGSSEKYHHELIGCNSRLDTIQAAVLLRKLEELSAINLKRRSVAEYYSSNIDNPLIVKPKIDVNSESSWHLFVVEIRGDRPKFMKYMSESGVETLIHYPKTILGHQCFRHAEIYHKEVSTSERLANSIVSLPMGGHMTPDKMEYVVKLINSWDGASG